MTLLKLVDELKRDERFVRHGYMDDRGNLTIGYGRLIDKKLGGGLTEPEAHQLLLNDIASAIKDLDRNFPWWRGMPDDAQRALSNMCFNLGLPHLSLFVKMLAAMKAGDMPTAADEALDSRWAGQVGDRAIRIAELIRGA
ncbi:hypothetical protein LCGC14_1614470 [marine sediment metagenome]|uniref:Lysozyme n=1 Tax=marine sediment metagenome TaxID=412755 RepID=A0A0F9I7M9_9ZZZZ